MTSDVQWTGQRSRICSNSSWGGPSTQCSRSSTSSSSRLRAAFALFAWSVTARILLAGWPVWERSARFLHWQRDAGGARQPRAPAPRPRPDGPRVRAPARRRRARPRRADVDRALLAAVPRGVRGDALRLPDDAANRAGEGAAAPRRPVGHRGLPGGRVHVARLVQRPLHPAGGRDADRLPGPRPRRARERAGLHRQGPHPPEPQAEQDRRSAAALAP